MNTAENTEDNVEQVVRDLLPAELEGVAWDSATRKGSVEVETKVDISEIEDVIDVVQIIEGMGVISWNVRDEIHDLYEIDSGSVCRISFPRGHEVWLKEKTNCQKVLSPRMLPFILRQGVKYKPGGMGYSEVLKKIAALECLQTYSKRCINIFFPFKESVFSLSFSLAKNESGFVHNQMEFEYEGGAAPEYSLAIDQVLLRFDELFNDKFSHLVGRLNTVSKLEAIIYKKIGYKFP
jgi:hypothetical protein